MEFARDWANLPLELLIIIASRIERLRDLVIFSAVCPLWHIAYSTAKSAWTPKMPLLMLAENSENNPRCLRTVYDLAADAHYQMELPETFGRYCHECGDGWVFTLGLDMEMHLFNPHTRARLSLPPAQTLPNLNGRIDFDKPKDRAKVRAEFVSGVTLLRTHSSNELVVVLVYNNGMVTFARPGDSSWWDLGVSTPILNFVRAVVPYENNVMVVYQNGEVAAFDVDNFCRVDQIPLEGIKYKPDEETDLKEAYCVQSGGDLLALDPDVGFDDPADDQHADFNDPAIGMLTVHYFVFKFDFKALEWKQIHEPGDVALFVGNNTPIALRASERTLWRPECIFFTESRFPKDDIKVVGKDMGVFNLDDETFEVLYEGDGVVTSEFCPPFFYTPKLV